MLYELLICFSSVWDKIKNLYDRCTYVKFKVKKFKYNGNCIEMSFIKDNKKYIYKVPCIDVKKLSKDDKVLSAFVNNKYDVTEYIKQYAGPKTCFFNNKHKVKNIIPKDHHFIFEKLEIVTDEGESFIYEDLHDEIDFHNN